MTSRRWRRVVTGTYCARAAAISCGFGQGATQAPSPGTRARRFTAAYENGKRERANCSGVVNSSEGFFLGSLTCLSARALASAAHRSVPPAASAPIRDRSRCSHAGGGGLQRNCLVSRDSVLGTNTLTFPPATRPCVDAMLMMRPICAQHLGSTRA